MRWVTATYKGEAFLSQVNQLEHFRNDVHLWWLGQSGFLMQWNGVHILLDPYLSDSLTKKYEGSDKPHVRMCEKVIDPETLTFIDVVTSSHNHTDHLDGETLIPLLAQNPGITMIIPEANRDFVCQRIGKALSFPRGLNDGESIEIKGIRFTGVPAAHNDIERDEKGKCRYLGYVIEAGGKKIYHSGDTLLYPGMVELLEPYNIDLAILPINGNDPSRGVAGNLNSEEAAWLAKSIKAKQTVPCHYDMFRFNTTDVSLFTEACRKLDVNALVLGLGERIDLSA